MDAGISSKTASATWDDQLRAIVGREHVRSSSPADVVAGSLPSVVVEPGNEQELASVLSTAGKAGLAVIPRGGGTKLDWGNPPRRGDLVLSTARLNRIVEHAWADLTVTVEAGCTFQKIQETLAKHGQRIALDPLWPERATVGGVLSTNDSGALRLRFGSLRDLIIGITLALPDGTLAHSGGKVVKNVAGYDLQKLATGALGTLGVITRAVFRVHPTPKNSLTLTVAEPNLQDAQRAVLSVQASKLAHAALQLRLTRGANPEIDVLFEGTTPGLIAQRSQLEQILASFRANESSPAVWNARQELFIRDSPETQFAVAKITILPASISEASERIMHVADERQLHWKLVMQATGIGHLRLQGAGAEIVAALQSLRAAIENDGGSLVLLESSTDTRDLDRWGKPGDAFSLMRALKQQFDPSATLNPGRFVGGI